MDVFDILCTYWQVQLSKPEELAHKLEDFTPDRDTFSKVKKHLKGYWDGKCEMNTLELASHYYFNSNTSYGPHFLGWPSDIYLNPVRYNKMIEKVKYFQRTKLIS